MKKNNHFDSVVPSVAEGIEVGEEINQTSIGEPVRQLEPGS